MSAPNDSAARARVSRRAFVVTGAAAGAGLLLGFRLDGRTMPFAPNGAGERSDAFAPNAWIRLDADGAVTIQVAKSEMGQGVWTALPLIVAEEMEADWSKVRVEKAPLQRDFGSQDTGGSGSVRSSYQTLRRAGATARVLLVSAAAKQWSVPESECAASNGVVTHTPTGRTIGYGQLAAAASALPAPDPKSVPLKDPKSFRLLGTSVKRLDTPAKVNGTAQFAIDTRLPGMLHASVVRCPYFGGTLKRMDAAKASAVPGVRHVIALDAVRGDVHLPARVAVLADNTWAAMQGRKALVVEWDAGANAALSSEALMQTCRDCVDKPGVVAQKTGGGADAAPAGARVVEATYEVPFLAHATMEPMNCTADVRADRAEVWSPTQFPAWAMRTTAAVTGLKPEQITVHVPFLGGGFGRRANPDFTHEAVELSKRVGAPVKVTWTREDDIRHDFYRPASVQRLRAALGTDGAPVTWHRRIVGPSTAAFWDPETKQPQEQEMWGSELPYAVANTQIDFVATPAPHVPLGWWRAVGSTQNVFCAEAFVDELAAAAGQDPLAYRRRLAANDPRMLRVLDLVAERSGWAATPAAGVGRGVACFDYDGTRVAGVVEASLEGDGKDRRVRARRVVYAFDCGQVINADTLRAQVEGSVAWALGAALYGAVTLKGGRVEQSNFHDYRVLRFDEMPRVEVHLVESHEEPSGAGEPAVPVVAPALVNALYTLTGKRIRTLPIRLT